MILCFCVLFLVIYKDSLFVISYAAILFTILAISTLSYDEYENGMSFLFTLPFSRNTYVVEKYLFGMLGTVLIVLLSSALFGLTHLLNLFSGAAVGATALQVGYSFLIGCMLAVVYLHTGSLCGCIFLHAVYNFGGMLVPTLGQGAFADIWNLPTVLITAVLAVFAIVFYLRLLLREDALRAGSLCRLTAEQRFALRRIHV